MGDFWSDWETMFSFDLRMSVEDGNFLKIMSCFFTKNSSGSWKAALPLREAITQLPNNREDALRCLKSSSYSGQEALDEGTLLRVYAEAIQRWSC